MKDFSVSMSGDKLTIFYRETETEMDAINAIFQETKAQAQVGISANQVFVSVENCRKIEVLLTEYFKNPNYNQKCFYALLQLDGVLMNFANFGRSLGGSTHISKLRMLGSLNLLPLPAAERYLVKHLSAVNESDVLIKAVANSSVESALIILKYLSPQSIFNKDPEVGNHVLELAIAKGRYHVDTSELSSLNLGYVIDAIFTLIKKAGNLNTDLLFNNEDNRLPVYALAIIHGDIKSTEQFFELDNRKHTNESEETTEDAQDKLPSYEDMSNAMCAYTTASRSVERLLKSEDDTHYHYDTYSCFKENEWIKKIKECVALVQAHKLNRNSKLSP